MLKKMILMIVSIAAVNSVYAGSLYFSPALMLQDNLANNSNYRGLQPRLSVGYADLYEELHFAAEIFFDVFSASLQDNRSNPGAVSAKITRSYGASVLPGVMITESVLGFVRLGVLSTQFSGPNTTRTAGQIGLGLQTCLTRYWDLRAEYNYVSYKTVPLLGAVKSDQVGLGLVYKVSG